MGIYNKLLKIQTELKAPKAQFNSFGKYNYRNCEDILEAVKPLLAKENCTLFIEDNIENVNERYYIKATAKLIDIESGESVITSAFAREEEKKSGMDGSQITGSSSSYARKYALNGLFCIDDTKDSDYTNTESKNNYSKQNTTQKKYNCCSCKKEITIEQARKTYKQYKKMYCPTCENKIK